MQGSIVNIEADGLVHPTSASLSMGGEVGEFLIYVTVLFFLHKRRCFFFSYPKYQVRLWLKQEERNYVMLFQKQQTVNQQLIFQMVRFNY